MGDTFDSTAFKRSYSLRKNTLRLKEKSADERLAQIIADFLRNKLLKDRRRFSFETVFSHPSKLDIMWRALHEWDKMNKKEIPNWFKKYYSQKISK